MLIDSHCHLPHKNYKKDLPTIIKEAKDDNVVNFINIGTSIKENIKVIDTLHKYQEVYGSIGIYPHEDRGKTLDQLRQSLEENLSKSSKIIGVGECGMDITNWQKGREVKDQLELFEMQINFANAHNLPMIIHNRNGDEYVIKMLKKYPQTKGVIHCFSSTWDIAKKFLDLGFYISFTGMITYPSNDDLREVAKKVPEEKFLVETDAPYLPPQGHRGEVNYPKYVKMIAEKIAVIRQIPFLEICQVTRDNTCKLFNI